MLKAALSYVARGFAVFPLRPNSKQPAVTRGFHAASRDPEQIREWWTRWPDANIGMPTEGMLVVDIDGADNRWGDGKELGTGPNAVTPRGGSHWLFRGPGRGTASALGLMVDTRGDGGYIVVAPSVIDGVPYRWIVEPSTPDALPPQPAWLREAMAQPVRGSGPNIFAQRPVAARGETPPTLPIDDVIGEGQRNHTLTRYAGAMRRTGMRQDEIAAGLHAINANRVTPPLSGSEVDAIAASIARYEPDQVSVALVTDLWGQMQAAAETPEPAENPDPGPVPESLMRVPGFINEVADWCMETAPYPNPVLAFAGALCLQGLLAGRKVMDNMNNRTNLYVLALANSATGKDHPRACNAEILRAAGIEGQSANRFASGEGLADALKLEPATLFQTDEIDTLIRSVRGAKDARSEAIMDALLQFFSSAGKAYSVRKKASTERGETIHQPHLVLFGTAIPKHYYESLSDRMLTNGLFSRMIVLESPTRYPGQEPDWQPVPERIVTRAKWWANLPLGPGNLSALSAPPQPRLVKHSADARAMQTDVRVQTEDEVARANGNETTEAVWGRVAEFTRRLALIYAVSENPEEPEISVEAVDWAYRVTTHQARRMLYMASQHVADSPFHALVMQLVRAIRKAGGELSHQQARKKLRGCDARQFVAVIEAAVATGEITAAEQTNGGRPGRVYRATV